ncbi:MAG: PIN domain nuclease [Actinomycetota bacterium]
MIVVDTSVWIDFLNENDTAQVAQVAALLHDGAPLALTDVIYTEILQGVRDAGQAEQLDYHLRAFPVVRLESLDDFRLAASLYRQARASGITIRKTLDCLIAAPCIREDVPILHADHDFDRLASCTSLRVFEL